MVSLESIMNAEEGHDGRHKSQVNRDLLPARFDLGEPRTASATYPTSMRLTTAHSAFRSPVSPTAYQQYAVDTVSAASQPFTGGEPDRRRSSASTDSTGPSYHHGYPYGGSPVSSSDRKLSDSPGRNVPVKLTPITRKPSRARKGVPVHVCELCRPPKTFTRAEHLRRHQLSHQAPELACPTSGCDKVFHRKDLLERHQQRHEIEKQPTTDGGVFVSDGFNATDRSQGLKTRTHSDSTIFSSSGTILPSSQELLGWQGPTQLFPQPSGIGSSGVTKLSPRADKALSTCTPFNAHVRVPFESRSVSRSGQGASGDLGQTWASRPPLETPAAVPNHHHRHDRHLPYK